MKELLAKLTLETNCVAINYDYSHSYRGAYLELREGYFSVTFRAEDGRPLEVYYPYGAILSVNVLKDPEPGEKGFRYIVNGEEQLVAAIIEITHN